MRVIAIRTCDPTSRDNQVPDFTTKGRAVHPDIYAMIDILRQEFSYTGTTGTIPPVEDRYDRESGRAGDTYRVIRNPIPKGKHRG